MNLLRVLLRSVCGSHPSDVPPKSKISVQIEQNGNGRRSGAFLHISFKNSSICKAFGVRQRPPQGAEFVCVPCGANNSKSTASDGVPVRLRSPAPKSKCSEWNPFGALAFYNNSSINPYTFTSIISVPATISARPIADFFVSRSRNTSAEKPMDTRMLSLSMGTTTLARPS